MKILVIDDNPKHLGAAKAQLADHDVTAVSSYDEAMQAMFVIGEHLESIQSVRQQYDVVLCDLLMPASAALLGNRGMSYAGQEMPVGIFLVLYAAIKNGAKCIGLLTDSNHHAHPASACLDAFNASEAEPTPFMVGECRVLLTNNRGWINAYERGGDPVKPFGHNDLYEICKDKPDPEVFREEHFDWVKSWHLMLDYLLKG